MSAVRQRQGFECGFTLVELMVVIALVAVITSTAAPGLREFASGQRARAMTLDLSADLMFARSEALKRNAVVTITPRSGQWSSGWAVSTGGNEILTRQASADVVQFTGAPALISFNVNGRVSAPSSAVQITVSPASGGLGHTQRCVELDLSGRARVKAGGC